MNRVERADAQARPNAKPARRKRPFPLQYRRKDIARLVVWRHNRLPDDGWNYVKVAAEHCPHGPNRRDELIQWLEHVCAPMPTRRQADDILDRVPPRNWSADALGRHLRLTDAERATLRCYTIGSYQTPKAERIKRRKEKHRLAEQARRRANNAKPREQSYSRTKPWEAFGIKRRAWERRGKPDPATTQIRAQHTSLPYAHELASSSSRMDREEAFQGGGLGSVPASTPAPSSLPGSFLDEKVEASSATTSTAAVEARKVVRVAPATPPNEFRLGKVCVEGIAKAVETVRDQHHRASSSERARAEYRLRRLRRQFAGLDRRQVPGNDITTTKQTGTGGK